MNAHTYYNSQGVSEYYDYDPLCEGDDCYYAHKTLNISNSGSINLNTDKNTIIKQLQNIDDDWPASKCDTNCTPGVGQGLITEHDYGFMGAWTMHFYEGKEQGSSLGRDDNIWKEWLPGLSKDNIEENIDIDEGTWASYECVPNGQHLGPWKEMDRTSGNAWIDYTDTDGFSGDVEDIFETYKERYLVNNFRTDTWATGHHYYDVKNWNDNKKPHEQVYGENYKILDSSGSLVTDNDPDGGASPNLLDYSDRAGFSARNPLFLLAKGCCSDSLKVERREQGYINEVRVSCDDL